MKKKIAEIELRGNRLFLIDSMFGMYCERDVTDLWHFFKDVQNYIEQPLNNSHTADELGDKMEI